MPIVLDSDQTRRLRLRAQGLLGPIVPAVPEVVRAVCGVQAQDLAAAGLSVRARSTGLTAADVDRARLEDRGVLRVWSLRGTLHLIATEDYAWLRPLLGPSLIAADRHRRLALGLGDGMAARGVDLIGRALAEEGPLTRAELEDRLTGRGVPTEGQALVHLLYLAALEGQICQGPDREGKPAYALLDEWAPSGPAMAREDALTELSRRYLAAYGPAAPEDLAAWSGLPIADARRAWGRIADELIEVETGGRRAWLHCSRRDAIEQPVPEAPTVRLLPAFDTYLLGYRDRGLTVPADHARQVHPGGGIIRPVVIVDGVTVGTWRVVRRGRAASVALDPFDDIDPAAQPGIQSEIEDVLRFLSLSRGVRVSGR